MTDGDISQEWWQARRNFGPVHGAKLKSLGVDADAIDQVGKIGVARITTHRDGTYSPAETGRGAVIVRCNIFHGGIGFEDLLAFFLAQPARWWLRRNAARCLGEWEIWRRVDIGDPVFDPPYQRVWAERAAFRAAWCQAMTGEPVTGEPADHWRWTNSPLRVYRHPLTWIGAGGDGVCLLDPRTAYATLGMVPELLCEDVEHGLALRADLTRPPPIMPRILVPRDEEEQAA